MVCDASGQLKSQLIANYNFIARFRETSKFTTKSHKMLQGDVGELFFVILKHVVSVSGFKLLYRAI